MEQKPKLRIVKFIFISIAVIIVGLLGFSSWYETTPTFQAYQMQKSIEDGAKNGTGCDIKDGMGQLQHLSPEQCAQYLQIQQMVADGRKQAETQNKEAADWQAQKQSENTTDAATVPNDWKTYTSTQYGITMRYPMSGYQANTDYGNVLLFATKVGPMGPENEFTAEWYIRKGAKLCNDAGPLRGPRGESTLAKMDDASAKSIIIGGLPGKIFFSGEYGMYAYHAYVKRADADLWYAFSLTGMKESDALFNQLLAGVNLTALGDIRAAENTCI